MYRLIESIKLQNRKLQHIEWHNKRFNETRCQLFGMDEVLDLEQIIDIPSTIGEGVYKCRVLYNQLIESIEFQPYFPRNVQTLQLVEDHEIDYTFKYEDRQAFDRLLAQKGEADDILIVRNGHITDTSYSNIVFFDGENWVTPDTYLLNGTQRQRLLAEGLIKEADITPLDLENYAGAKLINAMLDFEATPFVKII
ncbi:MAG TPA: aminotransferase class IV family protein [Bacteroidales bacterium]